MAAKFRLRGVRTSIQCGYVTAFDTFIIADDPEDAKRVSSENWRNDWKSIKFVKVEECA